MKNKFFIVLVVSIIGSLGFLALKNVKPSNEVTKTKNIIEVSSTDIQTIPETKTLSQDNFDKASPNKKIDHNSHISGGKERFANIKEWEESNFGIRVLKKDTYEYFDYETEQLEELVRNGDFLAMHVLAERYSDQLDMKNSGRVYEIAAIYGSSVALESLAIYSYEKGMTKKEELSASLSYLHAAVLRGDLGTAIKLDSQLKHSKLELSVEEIESIKTKGKNIFDSLVDKRMILGLGDFDTEVPEYVNKYYYNDIKRELFDDNNELPALKTTSR